MLRTWHYIKKLDMYLLNDTYLVQNPIPMYVDDAGSGTTILTPLPYDPEGDEEMWPPDWQRYWKRARDEATVRNNILNNVAPEIAENLKEIGSPREMWTTLEKKYCRCPEHATR